jgi:hypothetical protein
MKHLGLLLAAGSLTGCIIQDGYYYEEFGFIDSSWEFRNVAGDSLSCPAPYTTTAVTARSLSGFRPIIDLYDCNARFAPAEYPLDVYDMDIVVSNDTGRDLYAKSPMFRVDIIAFDAEIGESFIDDGGRMVFDWALVDSTTNQPLTCQQAGITSIQVAANSPDNPRAVLAQTFPCDDRRETLEVSDPVLAGDYQVTVTALDSTGAALGDAQNQTLTVDARNHYAEAGVITLPINTAPPTPPPPP